MQPSSQRDVRLDLLRILGSFAVVTVHVSAGAVGTVDTSSLSWWLANFSNGGSRWGNAVIMMVGGAILLGRASEHAPLQFALGRFARLLPAVLFWSAFFLLFRAWTEGLPPVGEIAIELMRGMPYYHLWFLYMMLGMYLAIPLLRPILNSPNRSLHYYLLALCAGLTMAEGLARIVLDMSHASFPGLFPIYLVYFVGGYLLYRDRPPISPLVLTVTIVLSFSLVAIGVAALYPVIGEPVFKLMYTNRGPLVIIGTFALFLLVLRILPDESQSSAPWHRHGGAMLARVTLGIYALHPFWIVMLAREEWSAMHLKAVWVVPTFSILVFGLSAASALLLARIPFMRRFVV